MFGILNTFNGVQCTLWHGDYASLCRSLGRSRVALPSRRVQLKQLQLRLLLNVRKAL